MAAPEIVIHRLDKANYERPGTHRWWTLKPVEMHKGVQSTVSAIDNNDRRRRMDNLRYARLYLNYPIASLSVSPSGRPSMVVPGVPRQLKYNVIKSCADTAAAKIAKSRPRPKLDTSDGDYDVQDRARLLQSYVDGVFYEGGAYEAAQWAFIDACVFGTGVVYISWDQDHAGRWRLLFDRVMPDELLVDDMDGRYGKPRQLHRRHQMDRDRLLELFPDSEAEILGANPSNRSVTQLGGSSDTVEVIESWHLPSGFEADDGLHAITIDNATLAVEKYDAPYFPFAFFRWSPSSIVGFWGKGLAEELEQIQLDIDRVSSTIVLAQQLAAVPRVYIDAGSQIVGAHLNPNMARGLGVVKYTGRPPTFSTAQAMSSEIYEWLERTIRRAYEITGISQMSAAAKKEPGLDTGVAIREFNDIASERFNLTGQRWEQLFVDLAKKSIDMSRRRYAAGDKKLSVKGNVDRFVSRIDWKDCDLDDDFFDLKVTPTSILPTTPAGKIQTVQELLQAGLIPKDRALELLDLPDIQRFRSLETAAVEDVDWTISRILRHGEPQHADELSNLQLALTVGVQAALNAKRQGVPEARQEMLRRWLDEVRDKLTPPADDSGGQGPQNPPPQTGGDQTGQPTPDNSGAPDQNVISDPDAKESLSMMGHSMSNPFSSPGESGQMGVSGLVQGTIGHENKLVGGAIGGQVNRHIVSDPAAKRDVAANAWDEGYQKAIRELHQLNGVDPSQLKELAKSHPIAAALSTAKADAWDQGKHNTKLPQLPPPGPGSATDAAPAHMMDGIGSGKTFKYKPGVPGEDPNQQKFGTTTDDLQQSPMGSTMVTEDPETGYKAIDVKEAVGPLLASVGNLNERVRELEGSEPATTPAPPRKPDPGY